MSSIENKKLFSKELAYIAGMLILAFGTAFMEAADYGVSMVVAPAYIIHLKVSEFASFFTFGMAEYTLQAVLIAITAAVLRRFRLSYLLSFVTAVIYGFMLDGAMAIIALVPCTHVAVRLLFFAIGMLCCSLGVALLFHTYIPPEAYELLVKEVSAKFNINISRFKTCYDCISCAISILLSFAFFGFGVFEGVKLGTVICALLNGSIIAVITTFMEKHFVFRASFPSAEARLSK